MAELTREQARINELENSLEIAESQISEIVLRIEDAGWAKIGGIEKNGVKLESLKKMTETHHDLVAANPIIGRGTRVRASYVWGQGLELINESKTNTERGVVKSITRKSNIFKRAQQYELENTATASGNVFFLVRGRGANGSIRSIPLDQITDAIYESDPIDGVKMFIRQWTTEVNGKSIVNKRAYLHRFAKYSGSTIEVDNETIEVAPDDERIVHIKFNVPEEWTFGVPDLFGLSFWTEAYKESMSDDLKMKKALSRFAWKVTAPTRANTRSAASQVAQTNGVGGTAGMTDGTQMSAINKSGAQVNFNDNWPLAAIIASGFDIPLPELLYQAGSTDTNTLSETNAHVLSMRQEVWCEAIETCFELLRVPINAITPHLFAEPVHRVAQAISVLGATNLLHASELREAAVLQLKRYGVQTFEDGLPDAGAWSEFTQGLAENPGTTPLNTPNDSDTSQRSPAGPLADGDNEMRDEK